MTSNRSQRVRSNLAHVYSGHAELWITENCLTKYNRFLVSKFVRNHARAKKVLDFGAGIGTLTRLWKELTGSSPECVEPDPTQRLILRERGFTTYPNLTSVNGLYDVIYSSNVLEHISDDEATLRELYTKLKIGGSLLVYVPASQLLFSRLDENVGHVRRYSRRDLREKLVLAGFDVGECYYVDVLGFFAWLYQKLKDSSDEGVQERTLEVYDRYIFPISRFLDAMGFKYVFGKNLFVSARKLHSND